MKRILALVLAVTLLLSLFVAPVAAEGGRDQLRTRTVG